MREGYVLEWLDTLVTVTLNPVKSKIDIAVSGDISKITDQVITQKDKVQTAIKSTVFTLNDEAKIRCLIKKYHSSLITLLDQALEDLALIKDNIPLKQVLDTIIVCIDELLTLIEHRFTSYLSVDERVPATYLAVLKKELTKRLSAVDRKLRDYGMYLPAFRILKQELEKFLTQPSNKHTYIFQEILYIKDLCLELEHLEPVDEAAVYSRLDELLISMNFNSKTYIYSLTQRLAASINDLEKPDEKMDRLLFYLKLFKQYHKRPGIVFNRKDAELHKQVSNWFTQEVFYLEKQIHYSIVPIKGVAAPKEVVQKEKPKLLSILSVDQMALILRAADDLKVVMARSLNSVFKNIVPYLSTPYQENISYDSMRSKSYSAETRDKQIVVETLQQMIKRINEY
ncbi:MAG: hypothetical protein ABS68_09075 [Niastella sp. SCN 39-18]|nr:hypothetical protein [Sphingobacteriales bacterium]ODT52254.1 MAG: hypothetical protein ABS68_09075 [Niastella sp. SCN 39-18]OJW10463.1 MAG: hypothetical protein BGO53_09810 [Sphingobacteriales bacterium 39-19]